MYIKQIKKKNSKGGKTFLQYHLVQSLRINGKPTQRTILFIGANDFLANEKNRKIVSSILENMIQKSNVLFESKHPVNLTKIAAQLYEKYLIKHGDLSIKQVVQLPPSDKESDFQNVDINSLNTLDCRTFGAENVCLETCNKLGLSDFMQINLGWSLEQTNMALISIISRALFSSSENKTEEYLTQNSSLCELFKFKAGAVTRHHLYQTTDVLFENKTAIESYLYNKVVSIFEIDDKLVIYDLSNTYFEGRKSNSTRAQFGRSKEKRNDCKQVVFTGVINAEGFIRYSRIYDGNTADSQTLEDMIADLKLHNSSTQKPTVVMDAGFATEGNLEFLRKENYNYVCVARTKMKNYKEHLTGLQTMTKDKKGNPISLKLINHPDYKNDKWMYIKSEMKEVKEKSIDTKLSLRFEQEFNEIIAAISKPRGTKKLTAVWQRIGRLKEKYKSIQNQYNITLKDNGTIVTSIKIERKTTEQNIPTTAKDNGVYFMRTNLEVENETQLWDIYNTIREVESTFRCLKTDLQIRPIHHKNDSRVDAHIFQTIIAYQIINTIRFQLKQRQINYSWTNIIRILKTQILNTIEVKTKEKTIGIRKPSIPIKEVTQLYKALSIEIKYNTKKTYVVYH